MNRNYLLAATIFSLIGLVLLFLLLDGSKDKSDDVSRSVTPVFIPSPQPTPVNFSETAIPDNAQWEPVIQEFEGVEMVLVPAGCFMMGSGDREDEQPIHEQC